HPDRAPDAASAGARVGSLDVARPETFEAFAASLAAPSDVLGNNAGGAAEDASLASVTAEILEDVFRPNVFGLALLTRALVPSLRAGGRRTIVNVSSSLGSLAITQGGFSYAYCASKAALNMLTVQMHKELATDGVTAVALDPGGEADGRG